MKNKRKFEYVKFIFVIVAVALLLTCVILQFVAPETQIAKWFTKNVWDLKKIGADLENHIPILFDSLVYILIIYCICSVARFIFKIQMKKNNRTKTIYTLLDGFTKYGCAIAIIILILKACGVDTTALIASVGVLTLIVGLGAQSLIADIIAGIFIIFENEYNVGEIISVDGFRGTVIEIGIRSTKVLDAAGNIKIINNSNIGDIVNLSRENSLAIVDLDFPYDVPVEVIEDILFKNFDSMKANVQGIIDGPYYKGICDYKDSNVTLKIVATCKEEDRFQVERDLRKEYRAALVKNNIDISYPQVVLNYAKEKEYKSNEKTKKNSKEFSDAQRELSKGLEDQENN